MRVIWLESDCIGSPSTNGIIRIREFFRELNSAVCLGLRVATHNGPRFTMPHVRRQLVMQRM